MIQVWIILHGQNYVDKNKWLSPAYLPGENVRQPRISSDPLNLKILVVHTVHIETFLLQQLSICGMIFHTKSKVLET